MATDTDGSDGGAGDRGGGSGLDLDLDLNLDLDPDLGLDADLTPGDGAAWALAGTLVGYGLILTGILVVLFLVPYALFALL